MGRKKKGKDGMIKNRKKKREKLYSRNKHVQRISLAKCVGGGNHNPNVNQH